MLHHFGVLEGFGLDFVDDREVDLVGGEERECGSKGEDETAHTDIMAPGSPRPMWGSQSWLQARFHAAV
jgi:hypothetical protein